MRTPPPGRWRANASEAQEQAALIRWANIFMHTPGILFHVPNGGKRDPKEAAKFKRLGVRAGIPDLFLAIPTDRHHGLFLEMKSKRGKLTSFQEKACEEFRKKGYFVAVCHSWIEAVEAIEEYLGPSLYGRHVKKEYPSQLARVLIDDENT